MKPENRPKIKFEGREYDDYQATQKQRQIERTIRKQRRRKAAFEAAGLTEDAQAANIRLRRLNQEYKAFSKAAGLPEQRERMRVLEGGGSQARPLANLGRYGTLKDIEWKLHEITEETIQRVPKIVPDGWSDRRAEALQEAHRDLLRFVKDQPVGTEAGAIYSPEMVLLERVIGKEHEVRMPSYSGEHILIHNHPGGLIFSETDIRKFIMNYDLNILTAVGNNGTVYLLQKTSQYNPILFAKAFGLEQAKLQQMVDASCSIQDYVAEISHFLKEAKQYGISFIIGG